MKLPDSQRGRAVEGGSLRWTPAANRQRDGNYMEAVSVSVLLFFFLKSEINNLLVLNAEKYPLAGRRPRT